MKKVWDRLGIAFSSACVVHCIFVAFLPLFFPALAIYTHQTWVHLLAGSAILIISPVAFVPGLKKHGLSWIIKTAGAGLLFIVLGILAERDFSEQVSHGITIFGSLLLVFAHYKNIQHSHRHKHACC